MTDQLTSLRDIMEGENTVNFGVLDNRFLAKSVGILNPRSPFSLHEQTPVKEAFALMKSNNIGAVVVLDAEDKITGIFTERDIITRIVSGSVKLSTPLKEVMTKDPQTIKMTTTIAFALNMMSGQGYRHLPVIDDDRTVVGIISVKDIIDYIARSLTTELINF